MQSRIQNELFDQLSDKKFAKPQLDSRAQSSIDVAAEMKQALASPLFYPPLSDSVFAGDTIAIGLQSDLPHPDIILDALLTELGSMNIEPSDIVVVITSRTAERLGISKEAYSLSEASADEGNPPAIFPMKFGFHSINFQVHDPENSAGFSYLVANAAGDPIHLNRTLVDADVILPIGSPTAGEANQQADCIYPDFSNESSRARFASGKGSFVSRWEEIELANDTLGSFFTIQVICGPGDHISQIVCGARKDATDKARRSTNELWTFDWPHDSEMTIGTVESDARYQNWTDFANALIAASRVTTGDGPIVIWSEIGMAPDRKIRQACLSQFNESPGKKMTAKMKMVAGIMSERPVYLKSNLNRNDVEELGIGFIESADEVKRIAEPHENCLLIRDAHKCQIGVLTETNAAGVDHE